MIPNLMITDSHGYQQIIKQKSYEWKNREKGYCKSMQHP